MTDSIPVSSAQQPPVPDWAERVMSALHEATVSGRQPGRLTQTEQDLISAAWVLLCARFGRTSLTDPLLVARLNVEGAAEDLRKEESAAAGRTSLDVRRVVV